MQRKEKDQKKKLKYDPVDGLLPEIRRVCGFPVHIEETSVKGSAKKKKVVEEEWSMPEAQNCGFCSIGGDILCCDLCPASFHLACIGLEDSDIPEGNFFCNRCRNLPKNVRLFPPEKCSSSTSPTHRVENENRRNWETIDYQYKRLVKEAGEPPIGPLNELDALRSCWPDPHLLQALGMANPMDFSLPPEYLLDREFNPNDSLEEKRPSISGEKCCKCKLKDEWSPMIKCDFCSRTWHQKCVWSPPMVNIPKMNYWMCPLHTESFLDNILEGDEIRKEERHKLHEKYRPSQQKLTNYRIFQMFCEKTRHLRMSSVISVLQNVHEDTFYEEKKFEIPFQVLVSKKAAYRKGGRGKKKSETRFLNNNFSILTTSTSSESTSKKTTTTTVEERKDRVLDRMDKKRSIKFTEEDLISSIMPFEESARSEYLSQKMQGSDMEQAVSFYQRHSTMVSRCRLFFTNFPEKEITKLMRRDLDPVETVRGGGTQSIHDFQERTVRKKIKADVEVLVQHLGFGNQHNDRRFNSERTEAFFRRCVPPTGPSEFLNAGSLREMTLCSRNEAAEMANVWQVHPEPEDLRNLIVLAFDQVFDSSEARDDYTASSMTFWSKEPIDKIVDAFRENEEMLSRVKVEELEEEEEDDVHLENCVKQEEPDEYNNETGPLEMVPKVEDDEVEKMTKILAQTDFMNIRRPEVYEKAESIYEYEGFFGEADEFVSDPRLTRSLSDLTETIDWVTVRLALRDYVRRELIDPVFGDHNYFTMPDTLFDEPEEEIPITPSVSSDPDELTISKSPSPPSPPPQDVPPHRLTGQKRHHEVKVPMRKRGRPMGSKNRKDSDASITAGPIKKKRSSTGSTRGRGGRTRGSRGGRMTSTRRSEDVSQKGGSEEAEEAETSSGSTVSKRLSDDVERIRQKYARMMVTKQMEEARDDYFRARDEALESWTENDWDQLKERCVAGRLDSLIPYDPRYFVTNQRVSAKLLFAGHVPIAIQRCLTKIGTGRDCHVRIDRFSDTFCHRIADYHCDVIRDYHDDVFYLSTLATHLVIVDDVVIRRPQLNSLEDAERRRLGDRPQLPESLKCRCELEIGESTTHQENRGESVVGGVVRLQNSVHRIQIGCVRFEFSRIL